MLSTKGFQYLHIYMAHHSWMQTHKSGFSACLKLWQLHVFHVLDPHEWERSSPSLVKQYCSPLSPPTMVRMKFESWTHASFCLHMTRWQQGKLFLSNRISFSCVRAYQDKWLFPIMWLIFLLSALFIFCCTSNLFEVKLNCEINITKMENVSYQRLV